MRILIATYGSPHDEMALRLGAQVAQHAGEPLTILTVIEHQADCLPHPIDVILAGLPELSRAEDLIIQTKVRFGHPAAEIIREAKEGHYSLLIVGDGQDRNPLQHLLRGPTMACVVRQAPCSVLIAKGQERPIHRILLCDSGAERLSTEIPSAEAFQDAFKTSSNNHSLLNRFIAQLDSLLEGEEEITILHVMSQMSAGPGIRGKQLRADAEELIEEHAPEGQLLEQDTQLLDQSGINPRPEVRHGSVVDEVLEEARCGDHDLVIIGAHCSKGWQRILLDDLAHKIVTRLDRPVLVVR
jgi:nucleotide-binding universal stress UspA family protein